MVEKNFYGTVSMGSGGIGVDEWISIHVTQEKLRSNSSMVKKSFGDQPHNNIPDLYAAFVFSPKLARGRNGIMLTEMLGIGDIREILKKIVGNKGYSQDIAWYPYCTPKTSKDIVVVDMACTMMIG